MTGILAVAVFVAVYVLIATEWVHRVAAALGGAALMFLIGAADSKTAFFSERTGVDWNVIFLLLGMMIIVGVLKQTGLFEYLAIWSAKRARGRPFRVMIMLVLLTAVASTLLNNVTTVLLVAPVTLLVCERLAVPVVPFLLAEAMASNIGGTATLVGDPPNIIIANRGGISFNDFLVNLAPFVAVVMVVFLLLCRVLFRPALRYDPASVAEVLALEEREAIRDRPLLVQSLAVLAAVTLAFVLGPLVGLEPAVVSLLGAGVLVALSRRPVQQALGEVEWPTLVFFMGLFVVVGGLVRVGVIDHLARAAASATHGRLLFASMLLLWASAVLSAIVDNIPYVATMAPIVTRLVHTAGGADPNVLWWALAIGANFGGNATAIGASANVVVLGVAERSGEPVSFWTFTRYGLVVTAVTVALGVPYLWLRYFVFR